MTYRGVRPSTRSIAPFTDVASHPGGHRAEQDTAIQLVRGSMMMRSALSALVT